MGDILDSIATTHAQVARNVVARMAPGVFARAALAATMQDFRLLRRMFPGVRFECTSIGPDRWSLVGTCADGSIVTWGVGE